MTIREAQQLGRSTLTKSPSAALDADCFLQFILSCDKTHLLSHSNDELTEKQLASLNKALTLRNTGLPVAYITGHKEFYGIDFVVTPDVLIPKPDTEILVEETLSALKEKANATHILTLCDMCTGSGCVGIAILYESVSQKIFASEKIPMMTLVDISDKALDIARKNVLHAVESYEHGKVSAALGNFRLVRSNLFETVTGSFDIITANPPYIPEQEALALLQDGRHEPLLALDGDIDTNGNTSFMHDGLTLMRSLVPQAYEHLAPGGVLLVEAGEYNAEETQGIFERCGFSDTKIVRDLAGQLRVIYGQKKETHGMRMSLD
jgi:release factor glutamine methyltransferase